MIRRVAQRFCIEARKLWLQVQTPPSRGERSECAAVHGSARQSSAAAVLTPGIDGGGGSEDRWSPDREGAGGFGDGFGVRDALKARYGPNSTCTPPRPPSTRTQTHLLTHLRGRRVHHRCTTALTETLRDLPQLNALDRSQIMVCVMCGCVCLHRHPRCAFMCAESGGRRRIRLFLCLSGNILTHTR